MVQLILYVSSAASERVNARTLFCCLQDPSTDKAWLQKLRMVTSLVSFTLASSCVGVLHAM